MDAPDIFFTEGYNSIPKIYAQHFLRNQKQQRVIYMLQFLIIQ